MPTTDASATPPPSAPPYVAFSVSRILTIASNTLVELTRQKVFYTLLVFGLVIIATAGFFAQFTFEREEVAAAQIKFVKDFGLAAISIFGAVLAIVGTAQLLPAEIDNRTLYTILAKPVRRLEFLLGKYVGVVFLLAISVVIMSLLYFVVLDFKARAVIAEESAESIRIGQHADEVNARAAQLWAEAHDLALAKAVLLLFMKMALLGAMALFFSTFSTSMIFTVVVTTCLYFIGHLQVGAQESVKSEGGAYLSHFFMIVVTWIVPNLQAFNIADDINEGKIIPWMQMGQSGLPTGVMPVVVYGLLYITFLIWFAHIIFEEKEI